MSEIQFIYKEDGAPFADKRAASRQQTILERQGTITSPVELESGGFALEVLKTKRPKRVPLGTRNVWSYKGDPNFVYRGVNDDPRKPGRIPMFEAAGWEVVTGDNEEAADPRVGQTGQPGGAITAPGGMDGVTMVLMRKRRDWFDEDMAEKQKIVDASEVDLRKRAIDGQLHSAYPGRPGISISDQGN